jgi:DNA adenine methylase
MSDRPARLISASNAVAPLLRWAGSKRKLLPDLLKCVPPSYARYIEPFCGSACLFFELRPAAAILSDFNDELVLAYKVLKAHPKLLYRAVAQMPLSKAHYSQRRDAFPSNCDDLATTARFIYLNRNCFNGVYRTNRAGHFNVPRGKKVGAIPSQTHFIKCANALKQAEIVSGDFQSVLSRASAGDFVYLDPPYAKVGTRRRGEYGYSSFDIPDLKRLAQCLHDLDGKKATFLLSYADCEEVRELSNQWDKCNISVPRHVAGFQRHRAIVREILVSNRSLDALRRPKQY